MSDDLSIVSPTPAETCWESSSRSQEDRCSGVIVESGVQEYGQDCLIECAGSLILVSAAYTSQELTHASAGEIPEENFKLNWKLPVGVLKSIASSEDGTRILLSALFDGYSLYDSKGQAIWRLPDPYAGHGEFSADGKSILLTDSRSQEGKQKVSLIDANSLHEIWNYTLDRVDYARLSRGSVRAVIVGAVRLATGGWQKLLVVKEKDGTTLLSLKFGRVGEYLELLYPTFGRGGG